MKNEMTNDDVATMMMFLAENVKENGIAPLGYKMNTSNLTDNSVDVQFENSTGRSRAFRIKLEIVVNEKRVGMDAIEPENCPGCNCAPVDGLTVGCSHPDGCGVSYAAMRSSS